MSIASAAVLAKLRDELRVVMTRTVALASAARFRRVVDEARGLVAMLDPTQQQRAEAAELRVRLQRWGGVVAALIRRHAIATPAPVDLVVQRAETYVLLQRKTPPDVPERRWRLALEDEWLRTGSELEHLLDLCVMAIPPASPAAPYERIDIRIDEVSETSCRVSIGSTSTIVLLPFTHSELAAFVDSCRSPRAGAAMGQIAPLESFGRKLFSVVTYDVLAHAYHRACEEATNRGARVCLQFDVSGSGPLARAPWELLHDSRQFLAVQQSTAIVRSFAHTGASRQERKGPLRVLVTISSPRDRRSLNTTRERELLQNAVGGLELLGRLEIEFAPDGTLDTLRRMLRRADEAGCPYGAWHFIGHCSLNERYARAELAMTTADGKSHLVGGDELQVLFGAHPALELAVLNACQSGLGGTEDVNTGIASTLMHCGVPAVVAMQFEISDAAALVLCEELYGAIANGAGVLAAVTEARRALFCRSEGVEWMTPVLFLRTDSDASPS